MKEIRPGNVYLVGAGPGDPGLITVRGRALLDAADVVVHDALISSEMMATIPENAERIDVGKRRGKHKKEQDEIHRILVEQALKGKIVVRLKGGDPVLFGRGAEERQALRKEGIPCEIVPGVSAAWAAPASIGVPVTHREVSGAVTIVTGHDAATPRRRVSWQKLAGTDHTLVVFMGLARLREIAARLIREGRPADTPVAVVQEATTPRQKHVIGTLIDIGDRAEKAKIEAPAAVIVGRVVDFGDGT